MATYEIVGDLMQAGQFEMIVQERAREHDRPLTRIASNIPEFAPVSIVFGTASPDTKPTAYRIVNRNVR